MARHSQSTCPYWSKLDAPARRFVKSEAKRLGCTVAEALAFIVTRAELEDSKRKATLNIICSQELAEAVAFDVARALGRRPRDLWLCIEGREVWTSAGWPGNVEGVITVKLTERAEWQDDQGNYSMGSALYRLRGQHGSASKDVS